MSQFAHGEFFLSFLSKAALAVIHAEAFIIMSAFDSLHFEVQCYKYWQLLEEQTFAHSPINAFTFHWTAIHSGLSFILFTSSSYQFCIRTRLALISIVF